MRTITALIAISCTTACIVGDETDTEIETESESADVGTKADAWGGAAARVFYQCQTATIRAGTQDTWRYKTSLFNNTVPSVIVWVSRESGQTIDEYPPLVANKIWTDTFSSGRVTVKLVQKGAGKSIDVTHHTLGQTASSQNGWCSRVDVPASTGYALHDFYYSTMSWASRTWTFVNAGTALVNLPVSPQMTLHIPFNSNPSQAVWGSLRMATPCSPIIDLSGPEGSIAGGTSPGAERVKGFFAAIDLVTKAWRAYECAQNGGYEDSYLPVYAQLGASGLPGVPSTFLDSCGRGRSTMYLTYRGPSSTSLMCVIGYKGLSGNRDYLRVRAINATTVRMSDWMTVVAQ